MTRVVIQWIFVAAVFAGVLCLSTNLSFAKKAYEAQRVESPVEVAIQFKKSEGWGVPVVTRSSNSRAIQLWFHEVPFDVVSSLARKIGKDERRIFTRVEALQVPGQTVVQLHLRRRFSEVKPAKVGRKGTRISVKLENPLLIPGVSYTEMVPNLAARSALASVEHGMRKGKEADCTPLEPYVGYAEPWAGWLVLKYADCLYQRGHVKEAGDVITRLARKRNTPRVAVVLAALRLDEWPGTWNPWMRLGISNKAMANLPVSILQELNIRQGRRMTRHGRHSRARRGFLLAVERGALPPGLEWVAHEVRLEMMENAFDRDEKVELLRLFQDFPAPPANHPTFYPTLRLASIAYAHLAHTEQALAIADYVLAPQGAIVDPALTRAMVRVVQSSDTPKKKEMVSAAISKEASWFAGLAEEEEISASTSLMLATWLLDAWDTSGALGAATVARDVNHTDPTQALSEARLAVMAGARQCEAIQNEEIGSLPSDKAAFASLCHMGEDAPMAALDVWNPSSNDLSGEQDPFSRAVRDHATGSAIFFEKFSNWE
jgi:hypothetical protein